MIQITYKGRTSQLLQKLVKYQLVPFIHGCVGACEGYINQARNRQKASEELEAHGYRRTDFIASLF